MRVYKVDTVHIGDIFRENHIILLKRYVQRIKEPLLAPPRLTTPCYKVSQNLGIDVKTVEGKQKRKVNECPASQKAIQSPARVQAYF